MHSFKYYYGLILCDDFRASFFDGQDIAVKRLSNSSGQGIQGFNTGILWNFLDFVLREKNKNWFMNTFLTKAWTCLFFVELIASCKALSCFFTIELKIYHSMNDTTSQRCSKICLDTRRRRSVLDWNRRFDIIPGIARGILYLHHDSRLINFFLAVDLLEFQWCTRLIYGVDVSNLYIS